jgi:methyl-accepting chemotaxis protein
MAQPDFAKIQKALEQLTNQLVLFPNLPAFNQPQLAQDAQQLSRQNEQINQSLAQTNQNFSQMNENLAQISQRLQTMWVVRMVYK